MTANPTIENFKPVAIGALRAFLDVTMPSGMVLHRCGLFAKGDRIWVAPPSKQVVGRDGTVQRGTDGKARYEPCVSFVDRPTQERWSAAIIEAVRAVHPEAVT